MGGSKFTRRDFLKTTSAAALSAGIGMSAVPVGAGEVKKVVSANDKIVLGIIGLARGLGLMRGYMRYDDAEIGAICDVYDAHLDAASEIAPQAKRYKDFRKLLEQKDLDAVVIVTPPHWHALMTIYACQAGLDVFCEKPISRYPAEALAMAKAARDNKRVTQVGTQIHAGDNFRRCVEIVRSGILGKIMSVRVVCTMNEYPEGIGNPPDTDPLPGLDWDMWCGPASLVPFNISRFEQGHHRYFTEYSQSWLNEVGPHIIDLAFWALDPGQPVSVSATGGRFVANDIGDIPDTMDVTWEFPEFNMTWMNTCGNSYNFDFGGPPDRGRRLGVIFHGTNGTLLADYNNHKLVSEGNALDGVEMPPPSIPSSPGHDREFLDAIKTREQPPCNFDYHLPMALALNLGHVAYQARRRIFWDAQRGTIIGDIRATELATPNYRKPWEFPKV